MSRTRVLTGLALGIPIGLGVLYLPSVWVALVFALVTLGGAWEWGRLCRLERLPARVAYVAVVLLAMGLCWTLVAGEASWLLILLSVGWWLLALILLLVLPPPSQGDARPRPEFLVAGVLVLVPAWFALLLVHQEDARLALFLLLLVWLADSAAYFSGRRYGRTPLAARISPGKTREGLWGALAACLVFALLGAGWLELDAGSWPYFVGLSLLTVLFSVVGDLFKSLLKRYAGVKDSGHILPGHGGILDRIDSLTAAAPVFVFGLHWM